MRLNSLVVLLALGMTGCLDSLRGVRHYQERAKAKCEEKHSPDVCRPLHYPSEEK